MATSMPMLNIWKALAVAQRAVRPARRDGTNTAGGYQYATVDELVAVGRDALATAGLALVPLGLGVATLEGVRCQSRIWRLFHEESGEWWDFPTYWPCHQAVSGRDPDKAWAALDSYSLGYQVRDLLLVARRMEGEDGQDRPSAGEIIDDPVALDDARRAARGQPTTPLLDRNERGAPAAPGESPTVNPARLVPPDATPAELIELAPGDGLPEFPPAGAVDPPTQVVEPLGLMDQPASPVSRLGQPGDATPTEPAVGKAAPNTAGAAPLSPAAGDTSHYEPEPEGAHEVPEECLDDWHNGDERSARCPSCGEPEGAWPGDLGLDAEELRKTQPPKPEPEAVTDRDLKPQKAITLSPETERKLRAAAWRKRPRVKARLDLTTGLKGMGALISCAECTKPIQKGQHYYRGVGFTPEKEGRRQSRQGIPLGVAHADCVSEPVEQKEGATS